MIVRQTATLSLGALAFLAAPADAGPCADRIYQDDIAIGKRLDAAAARGKSAAQSTFATTHRQPTPGTVAAAEAKAGDLSEADFKAITEFMEEARKADAGGDRAACEKALADAERMLGQ